MNKEEAYSNKTLTEYLLGQLPDAETEQLDELSIRDDEFVARLDKVELELVDAYVEGELTGEMLDRFKSHYLGSPLRRGKVRVWLKFRSPIIHGRWGNRSMGCRAHSRSYSI